jgi:protein import protein ZIM17
MMAFTCTKCDTKQARTFSKDSYQNGVVLVRCGGCNNLHLVADNLGWFRDGKTNIEDLMKEKGSSVTTNVNSETMEFQLNQTAQPPKTQPVEI